MSELRREPVLRRWVAISTPPDKEKKDVCPFCPGNEGETPGETFAVRETGSRENGPGWWVRAIPNKYPLFRLEGGLGKRAEGMYDLMNNFGAHEIVIETPQHQQTWPEMDPGQLERILQAYCKRSLSLRGDKRFRQILITKHHWGPQFRWDPSFDHLLHHPHSHIVAMPFIPARIEDEVKGILDYYQRKDRCLYCDVITQELRDQKRIILETDHFLTFAPYASRYPYEVWIIPKVHFPDFAAIGESQMADLSQMLRATYAKVHKAFEDAVISMVLHTTPLQEYYREEYHWHLELRPRLERPMGFEWGTGFFINYIAPEEAAAVLRDI
ncbi:MAG: DUF4921 family protein [Candidatus Tectomicrobia bacterium]|uniref:DUF4921 family protein n=1 Tax=Tectimicrobiota bacterium TaxID=2528274 RepID=A0A932CSA9_UNCTE|nr:DUF4921 family protein [Candidatus Tectomicrobia bacterium]